MVTIAAIIFTILLTFVIFFQIGLLIGMPWGEYTMGGRFPGTYPWKKERKLWAPTSILLLITSLILALA